jgi:glycosyltransferase involved in cell wall biosynthesis
MSDLRSCVASILKQQYSDFEILIVVDHHEQLYKILSSEYDDARVRILFNDSNNRGQGSTMNWGARNSRGGIVCFIDDDAIASERWLSELVSEYDVDTLGVGGRIEPLWITKKPRYLPEEFLWMIGATGNYLPGKPTDTRNLWSANASYKRSLLDQLGGFSETFRGGQGSLLFQGECAEFGLRIHKMTGGHLRYVPAAIVYHKIAGHRVMLPWLIERAYRQGYSKAYIGKLHAGRHALSAERDYLASLFNSNTKRLGRVVVGPKRKPALGQFAFTVLVIATVLIGFMIGLAEAKVSVDTATKPFRCSKDIRVPARRTDAGSADEDG